MGTNPSVITKLWAHQQKMVDYAVSAFEREALTEQEQLMLSLADMDEDDELSGGYFWDADCGVGKTLASIMLAIELKAKLILVITVKNAIEQVWCDDIEDHTENVEAIPLIKGNSKRKNDLMLNMADDTRVDGRTRFIVVNYETARLLALESVDWDLVIADESHRLSGHTSKQSIALTKKLAHVPYKICMTGTAWADKREQIYGQMRFLFPKVRRRGYPSSQLFGTFNEWRERYATYYELDNIKIITGYKRVKELGMLLSPFMLRIPKSDAIELPSITHITRKFRLRGKLRKAYKEMDKEMVTNVGEDLLLAEHRMTQEHRLRQLTRGWYKAWLSDEVTRFDEGDKSHLEPLNLALSIVEEIGNHPTVIFTTYREDVQILKEALEKLGKDVKLLTADVKEHQEFNKGSGDILIANISAGSTGIKLYRANYIVYYTMANSRTQYLQSIDRVYRPPQDKPVTVYHIMAEGTIDETIYKRLTKKEANDDELKKEVYGKSNNNSNSNGSTKGNVRKTAIPIRRGRVSNKSNK